MLWLTIIEWAWTWYWKLCRTRWITASEICVILHIIRRKPNSTIVLLFIQNISMVLTNLPSSWTSLKTFAWFSAQLESMDNYYLSNFSKCRWHSLSNSFYVSCLLIFFCSVLVIYLAISSFDSCRPAAQLFRYMLKKSCSEAPLPWNEVSTYYRIDRSQQETKSVNWLH